MITATQQLQAMVKPIMELDQALDVHVLNQSYYFLK